MKGGFKGWKQAPIIYGKTIYVNVENGEILDPKFKEEYNYCLENSIQEKNGNIITTTRGVALGSRKNRQLTLF